MVIIKIAILIILFFALVYAIAWVFQGVTERNGARNNLHVSPGAHARRRSTSRTRAKM